MLQLTTGGTGLYDTTLAAYRQPLRDYNPDYYNSVILLTDGADDDPGSVSLTELLKELRSLKDPSARSASSAWQSRGRRPDVALAVSEGLPAARRTQRPTHATSSACSPGAARPLIRPPGRPT